MPITGYEVQYQRDDDEDDDDDWTDATVVHFNTPTTTEHKHEDVEGGSFYEYRVRAVNGNGPGQWHVGWPRRVTVAHKSTVRARVDGYGHRHRRGPSRVDNSGGQRYDYRWLRHSFSGTVTTFGDHNEDARDLLADAMDSADTTLFTVEWPYGRDGVLLRNPSQEGRRW